MLPERQDCPECGNPLPLKATKCRCGWKSRGAGGALVPAYDPFLLCCEWVSAGRCHYPGSRSSNLNGSGPWYCKAHDGCTDALFGAQIVEQSHRDVPKPDYSYAARKVAAERSMEERYFARLRSRSIAAREPGQDDEEMAA